MNAGEQKKAVTLLRRTARLIINSVEYDGKLSPYLCEPVRFPRQLGVNIHNFLRCVDREYILLLRRRRRHERKFKK